MRMIMQGTDWLTADKLGKYSAVIQVNSLRFSVGEEL